MQRSSFEPQDESKQPITQNQHRWTNSHSTTYRILAMMPVRDIVVVGASAGGFEALQVLVAGIPEDFGGAVFVTVHLYPRSDGILPRLLNNAGPLTAVNAEDGMPIEMNRIYVAPPDYHLVLQNGFTQLSHGPKENLQRPCINVMFRSAATAYGERVDGFA
jgi:two-component system, chemotaxis family, protein-glutamate methylesterase/glutaminase